MLVKKRDIFRQTALDRLASPERLDQLLHVVNHRNWLPLFTLGLITLSFTTWSILGRIPVIIEGRGILIYPHKVIPLQAKNSGQLLALNIKIGDTIKKGQTIAKIDQSENQKQLNQLTLKLSEILQQNQSIGSSQEERTLQAKNSIQQQRQYLQQSIVELQSLNPQLKDKTNTFIQQQRQSTQKNLAEAQALAPVFKERMKTLEKALQQKIVTSDIVAEAQQKYVQNQEKITEQQSKLKEQDVKATEQEKVYSENLTKIDSFQAQLKELDSKSAILAQQNVESTTNRQKEIQEVKRSIAKLQAQLENNGQIISQRTGRILEISVIPGQFISAGTRLGIIGEETSTNKMLGITYFPIAEGKKIKPGMSLNITPQTVKQQRFGGILGKIVSVSSYPISKEAAISEIGNTEVVESFFGKQKDGLIQVTAELTPDPSTFSGYQWSMSQGPQTKLTSGTTTLVRVKVEDRTPIGFIMPMLREQSGLY